jgi:hypothetical protein
MISKSEEPRPRDRGPVIAQKLVVQANKSEPDRGVKPHYHETRRNAAACFKTRNVSEPHYAGILVPQDLKTGSKYWVCVGVREFKEGRRKGQKYLSVTLKPFMIEKRGGAK